MLKTLLVLSLALFFISCDKELPNVEPKLVVGKTLENLQLKDQNDVVHSLAPDTYKLIFAFEKASAHTCNDFFNTQKADYLQKHHTQFIADISSAPSLIRKLFIRPGLKDFKHTVLLLEDEITAAPFRSKIDTQAIVVVSILNKKIVKVETIHSQEELKKAIEEQSMVSFFAPMMNEIIDTVSK